MPMQSSFLLISAWVCDLGWFYSTRQGLGLKQSDSPYRIRLPRSGRKATFRTLL